MLHATSLRAVSLTERLRTFHMQCIMKPYCMMYEQFDVFFVSYWHFMQDILDCKIFVSDSFILSKA